MQIADLAVFGGTPKFSQQLHVGRPNLGDRERFLDRMNEIWDRRWLTNHGPVVQEFERTVAQMAGVKHCIAICNGTVALEIAIRAAGLHGEVIVPSFTFIATAHALQWQEITPVFADVDDHYNLDPHQIERLITPRTTGIIGVHVFGRPCNVDGLEDIARRRNLKLLFDSAHAFGCTHFGEQVGGFGLAEVYSFHATKFLNAFEGGAIVTNSDELAARARSMTNFGFSDYDLVTDVGTNGKMTEVSAAMGLTSLEAMDRFIEHNRMCYHHYRQQLDGLPGVKLAAYDESERCNYQYIVLEIDEEVTEISRDDLVTALRAENVLSRRYFYPGCHQQQPYRSLYPNAGMLLPHTERLTQRVMTLPTGTAIGEEDIVRIAAIIRCVVDNGGEVSRRMASQQPVVTFQPHPPGMASPAVQGIGDGTFRAR